MQSRVDELASKLDGERVRSGALSAKESEWANRHVAFEGERDKLASQLLKLKLELRRQDAERVEREKQLERVRKSDVFQLTEELRDAETALSAARQKSLDLEKQMSALSQRNEELAVRLSAAQADNVDLEKARVLQDSDVVSLRHTLKDGESKFSTKLTILDLRTS